MTTEEATHTQTDSWEYKVWSEGIRARLNDDRFEVELNELGAQGWELCGRNGDSHIFKRPTSG